jgi:prolyl-tRNA synthetase
VWRQARRPAQGDVADIRNASAGDPSPRDDGGVLKTARGVEIGHVFKLGTRYSEALDAKFLDDTGPSHPLIMGCYGIGIGRILVAAIESISRRPRHHLARGHRALQRRHHADQVRRRRQSRRRPAVSPAHQAGVDVLLDDRPDARPGVKFADADLIGIPIPHRPSATAG